MSVYGTSQRIIWFLLGFINFFYLQSTYAQEVIQSNRKTANACVTSATCPTNAFCEHNKLPTEFGQCICQEGYFIVEENKIKKCHKVANNIGEPCFYQEACQLSFGADSECINGTCQCKPNSHFVPKDVIGEYCKVSSNCIGKEIVCRSGKCECPFTSHTNANRTYCHRTIQLGEPCSSNEECIAEHSMCHEFCICRAGYILNSNKTGCLKIASKLYDDCEIDDQCLTTIGCSKCGENNTCICAKGYHDVNYKCFSSIALGYRCDRNENCVTPLSECKKGICYCKEGYQRFRMQCSSSSNKMIISQLCSIFMSALNLIKNDILIVFAY
uniref:CSON011761 protein n=1 Tax=Culicoides sonorensis TaxID=179676 RepID=A0A336M3Z1_CULSO